MAALQTLSSAVEAPQTDAPASSLHDLAGVDALARLKTALSALKLQAVLPFLNEAVAKISAGEHDDGERLALQALNIDETCAAAWHITAVCRERAGDFTNSLNCYDKAFALDPDDEEIAYNLGHLAFRMDMKPVAEQLFRRYLARRPGSVEGANNLACALRDQLRFEEAIEVVRDILSADPGSALLWNTLGTILSEQGEIDTALTFYDEALRLEPGFVKARYNRANARLARGDLPDALAGCEAAIRVAESPNEAAVMAFAHATMLIASGDLERGWDAYERRFDPHHPEVIHFLIDRPRWAPEDALDGRRLLVIAEQGVGDEVMFANLIPDVLKALGPQGQLILAVEPRLVGLFQRSFPTARVGAHATGRVQHHSVRAAPFVEDMSQVDLWTPLGSLLRGFRRSVDAFPAGRGGYLTADPGCVAHWRSILAADGESQTVGLVWKSLKVQSARHRYYSPFELWRPLLTLPGVRFVNLQYGDCTAEIEMARERFGVDILQPPGLDLKADLDEVAALTCALDLTVGPPNAATNLAGACGAPVWLITTPGAWPVCGADHYPWYPQVRVFRACAFNRWAETMTQIADAAADRFGVAASA